MKSIRAGGIILNSNNQIAVAHEHLWGFPRGGVEEGESYLETAKREILEEVGIREDQLELIKEIGSYERYPGGITRDTPGAYPMEIHLFLFKTEYARKLIPTDDHTKEAKWVDINKVADILTEDADREFFTQWLNSRK
jgi:8-oxo-dGTP pyrophosphatase MutT (NUDIX family)